MPGFSFSRTRPYWLAVRRCLHRIGGPDVLRVVAPDKATGTITYRSKNFLIAHTVADLPARAMDLVSGIRLGQTATQF